MKTKLSFLFILLFMFSINFVKADTIDFPFSLDLYSESGLSEQELKTLLDDKLDTVLSYWEKNLKKDYPYYYVGINTVVIGSRVDLDFHYFKAIPSSGYYGDLINPVSTNSGVLNISIYCTEGSSCYDEIVNRPSTYQGYYNPVLYNRLENDNYIRYYLPFSYYKSNFEYIYNLDNSINITKDGEVIYVLNNGDIIPTYEDLFINNYENRYIEVDLNKYSYVALSLKDYNTIPESSYSDYVNLEIKGKLCITPVYNYGQTERKEILTGTQIQACSEYYANFTRVRFYLLPSDVKNHAIYYLKSHNTSYNNIVKIDTTVFDISYITEENKDNPQVHIDGKMYPTLSYDSLTDTATKSEDDGYIAGVTCALGDLNCYAENNVENAFDSLFEKPLEMMKKIWSSITGIFDIITEFISLLPEGLQTCLYLSFVIALIIGLLKILL